MRSTVIKKTGTVLGAMLLGLVVGCAGSASASPTDPTVNGPFEIYKAPNDFDNFAERCDDHGFRVFITEGGHGGIYAVADSTCDR